MGTDDSVVCLSSVGLADATLSGEQVLRLRGGDAVVAGAVASLPVAFDLRLVLEARGFDFLLQTKPVKRDVTNRRMSGQASVWQCSEVTEHKTVIPAQELT